MFEVPQLTAVLIFLAGLVDILTALFVRMSLKYPSIEDLFSIRLYHFPRTLILIFGTFLLFLAQGLWKRKRRSWILSVLILSGSLFLHLLRNFNIAATVLILIILLILLKYRELYSVKSASLGKLYGLKTSAVILALLSVYSFFGFFALQGQFTRPVTPQTIASDYLYSIFGIGRDTLIPITHHAVWFENSVSTVGFISVIFIFAALFAPLIESKKPGEDDKDLARNLVLDNSQNSSSIFSLMSDKNYFFNSQRSCFIDYKISYGTAIALGDPMGITKDRLQTLKEFVKYIDDRGLSFAFYNILSENRALYKKLGMKFIRVGEEAVIPTDSFNLETPEMKDIRYGVNRINKLGIKLMWYKLNEVPWGILHDVDILYSHWLSEKKVSPLTFSMGFYPFPLEDNADLLAVYMENKLISAFSFFPYENKKAMILDLMLRSEDAPNGTVEGALANAVIRFKENGYKKVSLGVAPLSNISSEKSYGFLERGLKFIFNNFNQFYGYKFLFNFKRKFNPVWGHKYLAYKNTSDLAKITIALLQVHMLKRTVKPYLLNET